MKVKFRFGIRTYSGTADDMTYGSYKKGKVCIGREYVKPKYTGQNQLMGAIVKNLASVYHSTSVEYNTDLKTYVERARSYYMRTPKLQATAFSVFVQMLFAWYDTDPEHIDLSTVTVDDIVTKDADVRTLKRAIEAGFIPLIPVYDDLTSDIE